jgi:hypothetical protein
LAVLSAGWSWKSSAESSIMGQIFFGADRRDTEAKSSQEDTSECQIH